MQVALKAFLGVMASLVSFTQSMIKLLLNSWDQRWHTKRHRGKKRIHIVSHTFKQAWLAELVEIAKHAGEAIMAVYGTDKVEVTAKEIGRAHV